jgi:hypothetical protein
VQNSAGGAASPKVGGPDRKTFTGTERDASIGAIGLKRNGSMFSEKFCEESKQFIGINAR